jgi:hypothetical protein
MRHDDRGPATANKFLQLILKITLTHFKEIDPHFPVVSSVWGKKTRIPRQMQAGDQMATLDVESAYDNLTHDKTYQSVAQAIDENFDSYPEQFLSYEKKYHMDSTTSIQTNQTTRVNLTGTKPSDSASTSSPTNAAKESGCIYWSNQWVLNRVYACFTSPYTIRASNDNHY